MRWADDIPIWFLSRLESEPFVPELDVKCGGRPFYLLFPSPKKTKPGNLVLGSKCPKKTNPVWQSIWPAEKAFFTPLIDLINAYRGDTIKFSGDALWLGCPAARVIRCFGEGADPQTLGVKQKHALRMIYFPSVDDTKSTAFNGVLAVIASYLGSTSRSEKWCPIRFKTPKTSKTRVFPSFSMDFP